MTSGEYAVGFMLKLALRSPHNAACDIHAGMQGKTAYFVSCRCLCESYNTVVALYNVPIEAQNSLI